MTSSLHEDVLPQEQQIVLKELAPVTKENGFYLAGGTALAIQLGHRKSFDFDWLTGTNFQDPLAFAATLRDGGVRFETLESARGTLHGTIAGVKTSFMQYHYPLLNDLIEWSPYGCLMAGVEDLACMKLAAVAQRGAKRDFIDIATLAATVMPLSKMLDSFRRKYRIKDIGHILIALCYFDDADAEPLPEMIRPVNWDEIKKTIASWVKDIVQ